MVKLGVNIDHVATIREARKANEPDPVAAARLCEDAGCDSIVCHLREDRRHIKDTDLLKLKNAVRTRLNLEMSIAKEIVDIACEVRPDQATLVPERRQEITTEGGLDIARGEKKIKEAIKRLTSCGIEVSLFIDPVRREIDASKRVGANIVELHTGVYSNAKDEASRLKKLEELKAVVRYAVSSGFVVNAGHGLDYINVRDVARIEGLNELNIGHSIISRSVFVGLDGAVKEMLLLIK